MKDKDGGDEMFSADHWQIECFLIIISITFLFKCCFYDGTQMNNSDYVYFICATYFQSRDSI